MKQIRRFISSKVFLYGLGAFLIFASGFVLYYGRQAAVSGSWKYVINHDDEYGYWAYAKGASEVPPSDGNPFYYEERGHRHAAPYVAANVIGMLSRILHLPVLFFFPIWHIGLPFVLWMTLFVCLHKIWRYPVSESAAISIVILLSTLLLRGESCIVTSRFSRPGDGLWLLFIWVSLAMNLQTNQKFYTFLCALTGAMALWMHPFYAALGMVVTLGELLWQTLVGKNRKYAMKLGLILAAVCLSGFFYFLYVKFGHHANERILQIATDGIPKRSAALLINSFLCYGSICALVFANRLTGQKNFTKLDRLMLFVFLIEPISVIVSRLSGAQLASHRYYFAVIEIMCLLGWMIEKMPDWLQARWFKKIEKVLIPGFILLEAIILIYPKTTFFLYRSPQVMIAYGTDHSALMLKLIPFVFLCVWLMDRFQMFKVLLWKRRVIIPLIVILAFCAYFFLPSQLTKANRNFPFNGAYEWFRKHAKPGQTALTASARFTKIDYLLLYTDLKSYLNYYGQELMMNDKDRDYRSLFYLSLLMGNLNRVPIDGRYRTEDKIGRFQLDYILVERPSVFVDRVGRELKGHLNEVYRDNQCLIWKVEKSVSGSY